MGELPNDVMYYIEHRFAARDHLAALALLYQDHVRTPRVMRSVLFLADGSVSMLRHNITVCKTDLAAILTNAEYVVGISEMPMPIRDMSLPFTDEGNLGQELLSPLVIQEVKSPAPKRANSQARYHQNLVGEAFELGCIHYMVAAIQTRPDQVRCYRLEGKSNRAVQLPLVFVLEQLAEHVEIADAVNY